ncbi:MAG: HNH endonuclease [Acidimicrobiia bacterium]
MARLYLNHRIRRDATVIALAERDGDRCWYCGCRFDDREDGGGRTLTIDHVEPLADGGPSSLANLRLCCRTCNQRKGRMGADAYSTSKLLALRRRQMYMQELQEAGFVLPKRVFNHTGIRWVSQWEWQCTTCGKSGTDEASSPGKQPCAEVQRR